MKRCVSRGIDLIGRFNLETGFQAFRFSGSGLGFLRGYKGLQNSLGLWEVNHNNYKTCSSLGLSQGGTQNIYQVKLRCLHMFFFFFFYRVWIVARRIQAKVKAVRNSNLARQTFWEIFENILCTVVPGRCLRIPDLGKVWSFIVRGNQLIWKH